LERRYAVVDAALGLASASFNKDMMILLESADMWENLLPPRDLTFARRALVFTLLSSADCHIAETIGVQHTTCLVRTFTALLAEVGAREVESFKPCLRCPWTASLCAAFGTEEGGVRCYPAGFVVPIRDPASIARCLLRLHHDPQLLLSQSQAALGIHQASLDWQDYADRALVAYQQILSATSFL
jgi:glycosyltransferase involved in cell wall biosynthesis